MIKSNVLKYGVLERFKDISINKTDFLSPIYQDIEVANKKLYDYYEIGYINLLKDYYGERYFYSNDFKTSFRRVNNDAFLKLIKGLRDAKKLEELYNNDTFLMEESELSSITSTTDSQSQSNNKYADTPTTLVGDLVDNFTTSQNKNEGNANTYATTEEERSKRGGVLKSLILISSESEKVNNLIREYVKSFSKLFLAIDPNYEDVYEQW